MRLVIVMAGVLATSALSSPGQRLRDHRQPSSPSFGLPQDTFIVGCELYLFGQLVSQIEKDGKLGHWIRKDVNEVCVNDVTVLDVSRPRRQQPDSTISKEIHQRIAVVDYFERLIRHDAQYDKKTDSVLYLGQRVPLNKEILICYSPDDKPITVAFTKGGFSLSGDGPGGHGFNWMEDTYVPLPPEIINERHLDATYHSLCTSTRGGMMVSIVPGVYSTLCSREDPESVRVQVRAVIQQVPLLAKSYWTEWDGRPIYGGLEIGDYHFLPSEVRAFVEAAAGITYYAAF